jgi:hypothetical protein
MITEFGKGAICGDAKLTLANVDRRTLTNVQRASLGLSPRGRRPKGRTPSKAPKVPKVKAEVYAEVFDTPPAVRLEAQLREMFARWPEWVRR